MALPLLFIGAAVATGAVGGTKTIKAVSDNSKAGQINEIANQSIESARDELDRQRKEVGKALESLGFPEALGEQIVKNLGSPKAMDRMLAYLYNVKPRTAELIVDEMLAICSDVDSWHNKKAAEEANAKYNEILNYGLGSDDEE